MDAVVNHIWQSTIFAVAAGMLASTFRNNSATVRYWIWFAAAMKFLVPFAALAAVANRIPLPQSPPVASGALEAATVVFRSSALPSMPAVASIFLIAVWLSGALVVLVRWWRQWNRVAADAARFPPIVSGLVHDTLRRIERAEGITPTAIVASGDSIEPGVLGIRKPVLIWPRHLTAGLSDAHIEAIVAHEVCHIVRRDNLLASMQILVTAVFWFHPLVWWIAARLVDERERACDERVVAMGRCPATYAESIVETCRLCIASPVVNIPGVTGGDLKQRIVRIMRNEPARALNFRRKSALVVAALVLLLLPTAAGVSACLPRRDAQVVRPGANIVLPKLIRETKPQYTPRAMNAKVQGEVLMECVVKRDGTVGEIKILKSLHPDLDQAALDAAANWVFEPGTRNGKPANVAVTITMAFTLK